jgi:hypothetical protein
MAQFMQHYSFGRKYCLFNFVVKFKLEKGYIRLESLKGTTMTCTRRKSPEYASNTLIPCQSM